MEMELVNKYFIEQGLTLGSVESFTGGLFAHLVTSVPGASKFYKGGFVTYATEEKAKILCIPQNVIDQFGVVSKEVAYYMANNGRHLLNVDVCVSFTGNAGPDAMEGKPVGEVHLCVATADSAQVYSLLFTGSRRDIQMAAIDFIQKKLTLLKK